MPFRSKIHNWTGFFFLYFLNEEGFAALEEGLPAK